MINHLAIIMDGNSRWAKKRRLPSVFGHLVGVKRVRNIIEFCLNKGINHLTLYSFSTEDPTRSTREKQILLRIIAKLLSREIKYLNKNKVKLAFNAAPNLNPQIKYLINQAETLTRPNQALHLSIDITLNWGNYQEAEALIKEAKNIKFKQPEPNLLIITGANREFKEQLPTTKLYFTNTYWPSLTKKEVIKILEEL